MELFVDPCTIGLVSGSVTYFLWEHLVKFTLEGCHEWIMYRAQRERE